MDSFFFLWKDVTLLPLAGKENHYLAHVINQHLAVFLHPCADSIPQFCELSSYEKEICTLSSTKTEYLMLYDGQKSGFTSR